MSQARRQENKTKQDKHGVVTVSSINKQNNNSASKDIQNLLSVNVSVYIRFKILVSSNTMKERKGDKCLTDTILLPFFGNHKKDMFNVAYRDIPLLPGYETVAQA